MDLKSTIDASDQMRALCTAIGKLKKQNDTRRNEVRVFKLTTLDLLSKTYIALQYISLIPLTIRQTSPVNNSLIEGDLQRIPYDATLSKTPRNLYVLWQEYMFGIGGKRQHENIIVQREENQIYFFFAQSFLE